jgi:hypothetical protein
MSSEHISNSEPDKPYSKVDFYARAVGELIANGTVDPLVAKFTGDLSKLPPTLADSILQSMISQDYKENFGNPSID